VITSDARLVAFYLPQFHPIPENDEWWGKGFTEWINVTRAMPQFEGHYQPRLPGELGFYDLRLPEIQQRQSELAKLYGISAFCFYFYWFNGKTLLERPLLNILENPALTQDFCLCWANENWTRRWDGNDQEILIEQVYSDEGDEAFIAYVSKYLRDKRYLRIDGRPVIGVYRPQLLPSMRETAEHWRRWCRQHGIGEIYLFVTHSFGAVDPRDYGCDAAVEFPPNQSHPPDITSSRLFFNPDFEGRVYDWSVFVERSRDYGLPDYTVFRAVCPSWDNEARKPGQGSIFVNSSPAGYCEWLQNAVMDTAHRISEPEGRLVFVNAWNEWAEGAYLEPDRRNGYAYLEATRVALTRAYLKSHMTVLDAETVNIAIVIHAFYPEILKEIIEFLGEVDLRHKLFVSTAPAQAAEVHAIMKLTNFNHEISVCENRGRDVLPFLTVMKTMNLDAFPLVLKLHTKKSPHRGDGGIWRRQALSCLARPEQRRWIVERMCSAPDIGLVGPGGCVISVKEYIGSNIKKLDWLASRMVVKVDLEQDKFVAGSMFFARSDALRPILNLALSTDDVEREDSQVDGTTAHAVERAFAYSSVSAGFQIASAGENDAKNGIRLQDFVSRNFTFADRA
jgi:lipopolysaccharide biosynthesis protein